MGTLVQDAAEVATISGLIDSKITAKGGTLVGSGGLRNAVAGINSIPAGVEIKNTGLCFFGSQFFSTGILTSSDMVVECVFIVNGGGYAYNVLFGGRYSSQSSDIEIYKIDTQSQTTTHQVRFGTNKAQIDFTNGVKYKITLSNTAIQVFNYDTETTETYTYSAGTISNAVELYIGVLNTNGGSLSSAFSGVVFSVKITKQDGVVYSITPEKYNGVYGFRDSVSGDFITPETSVATFVPYFEI